MNAPQFAPGMRALVILAATLTTLGAKAQGLSTAPSTQPGWLVSVGKAAEDLGRPAASRLASFAAPAAGFDLGSYRGAVESAAAYGLSYDAKGMLGVQAAGAYKFRVTASWEAGDPGTAAAHCTVGLRVDTADLVNWSGAVTADQGQQASDGATDLQPGPHEATFHVACDQPLGSRFRVDLALSAPGDSGLRPPRPDEIAHPATGAAGMHVAQPAPPTPPPPASLPQPAPEQPLPPQQIGPPPEGAQGQMLVATTDLRVRAEPRPDARAIGRLLAGQSVEVLGPASDPAWYRLAPGGYAASAFLRPAGAAGPPRPAAGGESAIGPRGKYKVGDCTTYRTNADLGNGRHDTVEGVACLQPDGRWRIVK